VPRLDEKGMMPDSTRRSRRLQKRRLYARSLAAGAAAAAVTVGIVVPLGVAGAGGDGRHARPVHRSAPAVDPSLVAASEGVQEHVEAEQYARAVFEHAAFEHAANEKAQRDSMWDDIAACETQGDWSMSGPSFSGGVGFSNSAWDSFGGREFAPNAGQATREQQIVVAERIRSSVGMGAWGCARRLGLT
jgi:Transglycosylase-like domain